jgi:hypothetical protein
MAVKDKKKAWNCNRVTELTGLGSKAYHSSARAAADKSKFTDQTRYLTLNHLFCRSSQVLCRHWTKRAVHAGSSGGGFGGVLSLLHQIKRSLAPTKMKPDIFLP